MMPTTPEATATQWQSVITISGGDETFPDKYEVADDKSVLAFMALDSTNPSSIYASVRSARENCRSIRHAIPTEVWESINTTWIELRDMTEARIRASGVQQFFDWVKERSSLFRGISVGTMLHDDAFHFTRLGTFMERGDSTARILDVKYHVLLPHGEDVGGALDYYQWAALLRSVSAFRNYRALYGTEVAPLKVAELLILVETMPRSIHHCQSEIILHLDALASRYGQRHECHRLAGETPCPSAVRQDRSNF